MAVNMDEVHAQLQRDVGRLEGKVESVRHRVSEIGAELDEIGDKIDRIVTHIEAEKASRRTLLAVGSVLGSFVGAVTATVVSWWTGTGAPSP